MNVGWVFHETGHCIPVDTQRPWPWSPPALAGLVLGVQIRNERLQPCAARTRSEQPGADASRCFYNTNPKAPLSKCKHTLPGQAAPASDNWARSLPGTRCRAPSTSKKWAVFTRIFKACYCLGRTHAQARNHRNGEASETAQTMEGEAEV